MARTLWPPGMRSAPRFHETSPAIYVLNDAAATPLQASLSGNLLSDRDQARVRADSRRVAAPGDAIAEVGDELRAELQQIEDRNGEELQEREWRAGRHCKRRDLQDP